MRTVDQRAAAVARSQRGLASRHQLIESASVSTSTITRRLAAGQWSEPVPGVVDLGTHAPSPLGGLQGLLLATGPSSWVSHVSAAHLHGFLDVSPPRSPDILVIRGGRTRAGTAVLHTTRGLEPDEETMRHGLRCTTPARTLFDIAPGTTTDLLERYAADLARRDSTVLEQLGVLLRRYPGANGRRRLLTALSRLPEGVAELASPLEVLGVAAMLRAGAPAPTLQYRVRDGGGAVVKRVDAAWPQARTLVEFDGAAYHDTSASRIHDEEVRARIRALGWTIEVLRHQDLDGPKPAAIAARLRQVLGA